jgi:HrpA-like RNA helicase
VSNEHELQDIADQLRQIAKDPAAEQTVYVEVDLVLDDDEKAALHGIHEQLEILVARFAPRPARRSDQIPNYLMGLLGAWLLTLFVLQIIQWLR